MADDDESLEQFRARSLGINVSLTVLISVIVPLKLYCRVRTGGRSARDLGLDDLLVIVSYLLVLGNFLFREFGSGQHLGKHVGSEVSPEELTQFLIASFVSAILYNTTIGVIKFALLALFWRIFGASGSWRQRIPILITVGIVAAWTILTLSFTIGACKPISAQWDITIKTPDCFDIKSLYLSGSIPNVITDAIILILPIPYVYRLRAPRAQRLLLGGIFMLGAFVTVVSSIRMVVLLNSPIGQDPTYTRKGVYTWSAIETNVGLICACLPTLKPAWTLLRLDRLQSLLGSKSRSRGGNSHERRAPEPSRFNGDDDRLSRSRRRGRKVGGFFGNLTGLSVLHDDDEEEDTFQMVTRSADKHGKSDANVEVTLQPKSDTDAGSDRGEEVTQQGPVRSISVRREWCVCVAENRIGNAVSR